MFQHICRWLLYSLMGWQKRVTVDHPDKFVICLAPHTSNWDFLIGQLYMRAEGMNINFLMKKEWFFWPLGPIFRHMGGIPVVRSRHTHMTSQLAAEADRRKSFRLCITPEGTRSPNPDWKKGFFYIAQEAGIPVLVYAIDFKRKLIECVHEFTPAAGDSADECIEKLKKYYAGFQGKHPENFA